MLTSGVDGLCGHRLLQSKLARYKERDKDIFNSIKAFELDIETKLKLEELDSSRAKVNSYFQSTEAANDSLKHMDEEAIPGDQPEIENEEISNQVS